MSLAISVYTMMIAYHCMYEKLWGRKCCSFHGYEKCESFEMKYSYSIENCLCEGHGVANMEAFTHFVFRLCNCKTDFFLETFHVVAIAIQHFVCFYCCSALAIAS